MVLMSCSDPKTHDLVRPLEGLFNGFACLPEVAAVLKSLRHLEFIPSKKVACSKK